MSQPALVTGAPAPAAAALEYHCPRCRVAVQRAPAAYACRACQRSYPIVFGIPDFRLRPDPYIGLAEDREKGLRLAREGAGRDLPDLLRLYWSLTPDVEPERAARFIESTLAARSRAEDIVAWIRSQNLVAGAGPLRVLEVGCGAGAALPVVDRLGTTVAVDRAFRWLVIARLWLERSGLEVPLVCADGRELPFADGCVDLVVADNVIEHDHTDAGGVVREAARVLAPAGTLFVATPNRFAPAPDPHFGVWLLGFVPRRWMPALVRRVRGAAYRHIRLLGVRQVRRALRGAGLARVRVAPARFGRETRARFSPLTARLLAVHNAAARVAPLRALLTWCGPVLWATGRKGEG